MPAWNAFPYIHEAVRSVLDQSYRDLELIVANDGSTDGDYRQLSELDPRVRVIEIDRGGVSKARNTAMRLARGRYFAFIDADDVWVPGKLEAQVHLLENDDEIDIAYGSVARWHPASDGRYPPASLYFPPADQVRELDSSCRGWAYTRILMGRPLGMITPVMRRRIYELAGGFDQSMTRGEDYEFWLRCSRYGRVQRFRAVFALYRMRPTSTMHQVMARNLQVELLEASRKRWGLSDPDGLAVSEEAFRQRIGQCHFDHGYTHFWRGDPAVAAGSFREALRRRYRSTRSLVYWLSSEARRLGRRPAQEA